MLAWIIENAPILFSGIGVAILTQVANLLFQRLGWFKGFFESIYSFPEDDLTGRWKITGRDISLRSHKLIYSRELEYVGSVQITGRGKSIRLKGEITEHQTEGPSSVERWKLTGRGTFHGNHLMVNYVLRGDYEAPTLGFLFWNVNDARTAAEGFFLARRSLDDESVNTTGIAFGEASLRRVRREAKMRAVRNENGE